MKTRIITAAVLLAILVPVLIFSNTFLYVVFAALLTLIASLEMLGCMRLVKRLDVTVPTVLYSVLTVSLTRAFKNDGNFAKLFVSLTFLYIFVLFILTLFADEDKREKLPELMLAAITIVYITFGFASFVMIRDAINGVFLFPLAYIAAWVSDTGAYFTGIKFGKTKLIPEISPKKTVEGFFGGLLSCVTVFIIYSIFVGAFSSIKPSYFWIIVCAVILSVASVAGDLIASMIKRRYKIKDYSHLFPGHGGVLDRFDSIIATSALLYILSSAMPLFK